MSIIFNVVKIQENTISILVGRFGFGICSGIQSLYLNQAISETIPVNEQQRYMVWINVSIGLGMLAAQLANMILPLAGFDIDGQPHQLTTNDSTCEALVENQSWKLVWGFPILLKVLSIIIVPLTIK